MTVMEAICSRRSVRAYTGEQITEEELNTVLKAANAAPVGMGQYDGVHLTVIKNTELLGMIDKAGAAMFGKSDIHPLYNAPMLIMVSVKMPSAEGMRNVAYSNAAIIAQNMALAATELGVGTCHIWGATMAVLTSPDILEKLKLPQDFTPCCAIALGKTDCKYEIREIPAGRIITNTIE